MSVLKITAIVGASIITAGSTAVVATRDKWWPKGETEPVLEEGKIQAEREEEHESRAGQVTSDAKAVQGPSAGVVP